MAQENSNSTMEMGTSDQVLVPAKKNRTKFFIGLVAMLVVVAVAVTLVVVLSGNEGGTAEAIVSTTEGTTTVLPPSPTTPIVTEATTTTTTMAPVPELPEQIPLELDEFISGAFSPPSFNASWTSGSDMLYRNEYGHLILYDIDTDETTPLIYNTSEILQQSSRVTLLSPDNNYVVLSYNVAPIYRHSFLARYTVVEVSSGNETDIIPPVLVDNRGPVLQNFVWGPSGNSFAYVYNNDIYYQSSLTSSPVQITTSGVPNVIYNGIPDWVYEEEIFGTNNALWFSRDGSKIAYVTFDDINVRVMRVPHYGVPGSLNYQYTEHHEIRYPKPGTVNPTVSITLHDVDSGVSTTYTAPADIEQPILKTVSFVTNQSIALMWSNRVQTMFRVVLCTHTENNCEQIYEYTENNGWIENIPLIFNHLGNSFVTILPQTVNGVLYKQIVQVSDSNANQWTNQGRTNTAHTVAEILLWTSDDIIWYKATSVNDSAEQHIYTVDAASNVECFTCDIVKQHGGQCLYNEAAIGSDGATLALTCAGPDVPQVFIYSSNGSLVRVWEDSASTVQHVNSRILPTTVRLSVPLGPGLADADVQLYVPDDYLNRTNMPLLVYVYAGPDTALVTKQWSVSWESSLVSRWGIAVAQIDGRGSGLRGVDNMFAVNRALGTVEIEDQITVTRYLQDTYPWLDANRTCIWGWSYGGYAASLALARGGDVFRCAAAVAPVVDWRFYDTIYTERYMDIPANNTIGYIQSSLLTDEVVEAYRNKRYFLIHGTADDNVHYQHAMLISRLLQRRDVFFTQMSYTDEDHGLVGVRPHLYHALEKFLEENML